MGMNFQLDRAWANTSKGIRQCQRADKALSKGNVDSAVDHFNKSLDYFGFAVDHLVKAEEDAEVKAGQLLDKGNKELSKAIDEYSDGHISSAERHYEDALDKYDEAFDLVH